MSATRQPRRRNAPQTKADILAAAQQAFAEQGYAQAGMRDIAALAGVSAPLLLRYYGSKAALFEAALIEAMRLDNVLEAGRERFGERLAALFLDRRIDIRPPSIIALAAGHDEARQIAARVTDEHVVGPLARWLGPPDGRARALEIVMLAMGFVLFTRQLPLISAHKGQERKVAEWLGRAMQEIVDRG
jgi:AcrR family transcriptional regulator